MRRAILNLYGQGTLSAKDKSKVSVLEVALELYCRGFKVLPVSIVESAATKFIIKQKEMALLPPLIAIEGLGASQAEDIVKGREEKAYSSLEDMKKRGKVGDSMIDKFRALKIVEQLPELDQIVLF